MKDQAGLDERALRQVLAKLDEQLGQEGARDRIVLSMAEGAAIKAALSGKQPADVVGVAERLKRIQRDMLETVSGGTGWIDGMEARAFVQRIEDEIKHLTTPPPVPDRQDVEAEAVELLAQICEAGGDKAPAFTLRNGGPVGIVLTAQVEVLKRALQSRPGYEEGVRAEAQRLCAEVEADAVAALRYIERHYGRLNGVGWDRVFDAHDRLFAMGAALLPPPLTEDQSHEG